MERTFKILFALAAVLFAAISIGIFLLIIKILLMFYPEVHILGLLIY